MKRFAAFVVLALLSSVHVPSAQTAPAQATGKSAVPKLVPRLAAALKQAKLVHTKSDDNTWVVTWKGTDADETELIVRAFDKMIVVSTILEAGANLEPDTLRALLEASYDANFAKMAIGPGGEVTAMAELPADFSAAALQEAVDEVAKLATEAGDLMAGTSTTGTEEFETVAPGKGAVLSLLRGAFEVSYDPAKWSVEKTEDANITQLQHRAGDGYARIIAERLEIEPSAFTDVIMSNAKQAAPDMTLLSRTPRQVNGLPVLLHRYAGTARGIKFTFFNQAYADKGATIQLVAWTGTSLVDEYRRDFLEFFAGFAKR